MTRVHDYPAWVSGRALVDGRAHRAEIDGEPFDDVFQRGGRTIARRAEWKPEIGSYRIDQRFLDVYAEQVRWAEPFLAAHPEVDIEILMSREDCVEALQRHCGSDRYRFVFLPMVGHDGETCTGPRRLVTATMRGHRVETTQLWPHATVRTDLLAADAAWVINALLETGSAP